MAQQGFGHIAIIGVGLLGGSVALAARKRGICTAVTGWSRSPETLAKAVDRGIIDTAAADPASAFRNADLVVLASPVGSFSDIVRAGASALRQGAVVTDVGSVKGGIVSAMEQTMPAGVGFVGCHPIAGSDRSGLEHADADLFVGARCIVTPTGKTDPVARETVEGFWRALGAAVSELGPDEHDRIYGAVSHLPHLVAYALMNAVAAVDEGYLAYSGSGFRDLTRIASSSAELWTDICMMNRGNILAQIEDFERAVAELKARLAAGDRGGLHASLARAQGLREQLGNH